MHSHRSREEEQLVIAPTPLTVLRILSLGMVGCNYMPSELDRTFPWVFFVFVVVANADIMVIVVVVFVEVDNVVAIVEVVDNIVVVVVVVADVK